MALDRTVAAESRGSDAAVTRALARFIVESRASDVPESAKHAAVRSLVNWLACTIGGTAHEAAVTARAFADRFTGTREASVPGTPLRLDIFHAAWVNGITSHVFDFDDTHLRTVIHPSPPIAPAILALAEHMRVNGDELIHAFVIGVDVACRIGNAVCPAHYHLGWHSTSTAGVFGAAAAAGRLLGLNETNMCRALGLAGTQAAGLRENLSTMAKFLHPGHAARDGMTAAFLARDGYTASERILEAPRGFAHVLSPERDLREITAGLGERHEITLNTFKPYPCGVVLHPAIDGCLQLLDEYGMAPGAIATVSLRVNFLVLEVTGKRDPRTGVDGKFSVYHCVAVALTDGRVGERQFSDERVSDPGVMALAGKVNAVVDPGVAADEAHVSIELVDGRRFEKHVEHALGSLDRPLGDRQLEEKFRDLADAVMPAAQVQELIGLCWRIRELEDVSVLARASASK